MAKSKLQKCPAHCRPGRPPASAANCPACLALQLPIRGGLTFRPSSPLPKGPSAPATSIEEAALALQRRVERALGVSFSSSPPSPPVSIPVRTSPPSFVPSSSVLPPVKRLKPTPPPPTAADTKKPTKCPKHRKGGKPPKVPCAACEAVAAGEPLPETPEKESPAPKKMRLRLSNGHSGGAGGYSFPILRMRQQGYDLRGPFTAEEWTALRAAWAEAKKERNVQFLGQELEAQVQIETLMPMRYPEAEREEVG